MGDERLRREHRMRRSSDYRRAYRRGRRRRGRLARLHFVANGSDVARLGITASRKVGNAVVRHRLKRRVREIFRRSPERPRLAGFDLVVHLQPPAAEAGFAALDAELGQHLRHMTRHLDRHLDR